MWTKRNLNFLDMIEIIRHTTKSGKKSPFWIVVDGLNQFKVASLDCAKRLQQQLSSYFEYHDRAERSETSGYTGQNRSTEVRTEDSLSLSTEFQFDTIGIGSNEIQPASDRVYLGTSVVSSSDITIVSESTHCVSQQQGLYGNDTTLIGIQGSGNNSIESESDSICQSYIKYLWLRGEERHQKREEIRRNEEGIRRRRAERVKQLAKDIFGVVGVYSGTVYDRCMENLSSEDDRVVGEKPVKTIEEAEPIILTKPSLEQLVREKLQNQFEEQYLVNELIASKMIEPEILTPISLF
jgi:hypothetical protein